MLANVRVNLGNSYCIRKNTFYKYMDTKVYGITTTKRACLNDPG